LAHRRLLPLQSLLQPESTVKTTHHGPVVYRTDAAWDERKVTWSTRSARISGPVANLGAAPVGAWVEWDLTSLIRGDGGALEEDLTGM
jgi:hypothetical protein